jgi:hypothetical protein
MKLKKNDRLKEGLPKSEFNSTINYYTMPDTQKEPDASN